MNCLYERFWSFCVLLYALVVVRRCLPAWPGFWHMLGIAIFGLVQSDTFRKCQWTWLNIRGGWVFAFVRVRGLFSAEPP